ncbi:MAG: hypothetical protein ACFFDI_00910 [Promethearchaeota archaeon]
MFITLKNSYQYVLLSFVLLYLVLNPMLIRSGLPDVEQRQVSFPVNETFDLDSTQILSYQFPLWLDWVGTHARVRIQGGVITGRIPTSLVIKTVLDGSQSQQTFEQKNGLQRYYTFHSDSEFALWIQPPIHPQLSGIKTLHNFTVELNFIFSVSPEGTGIIKEIIFETFTPPSLDVTEFVSIVALQENFSWQITTWSFGSFFFSTPLILPSSHPHNMALIVNVEFNGLDLDGWRLIIGQGENAIQASDTLSLEGSLEIDSSIPFELSLIVDPPQVSEPKTVSVSIQVQGMMILSQKNSITNSNPSAVSEKTFAEVFILLQLGIVLVPILAYYRVRRIDQEGYPKEAK